MRLVLRNRKWAEGKDVVDADTGKQLDDVRGWSLSGDLGEPTILTVRVAMDDCDAPALRPDFRPDWFSGSDARLLLELIHGEGAVAVALAGPIGDAAHCKIWNDTVELLRETFGKGRIPAAEVEPPAMPEADALQAFFFGGK